MPAVWRWSRARRTRSCTSATVCATRSGCTRSSRRFRSPASPDWADADNPERLIELGGVRILMMHGHTRGVKSSAMNACYAARECGAQILLFGHTHRPLVDWDGTLWVMNPGSIRDRRTYGVITLEGGKIDCAAQTLTL